MDVAPPLPETVRDLIDLWPSRKELARDLQAKGFELSADSVHKWARHGSIPAGYQFAVLECGLARGFPLTADLMVALHQRHPARGAAA